MEKTKEEFVVFIHEVNLKLIEAFQTLLYTISLQISLWTFEMTPTLGTTPAYFSLVYVFS